MDATAWTVVGVVGTAIVLLAAICVWFRSSTRRSTGVRCPPGSLQVERLPDGRRKLLRCLRYKVDGVEEVIEVPKGYVTDFSSDPIGLLDWSKVDVAGVIHDYLYSPCSDDGNGKPQVSRWEADRIWFKIATRGKWKSSCITAALGWIGMRVFGGLFWKEGRVCWLRCMTCIFCAGLLAWAHYMAFCTETLGDVAVVLIDVRLGMSVWRSCQRRRLANRGA